MIRGITFFSIAVAVLILDQLTKWIVVSRFFVGESIQVWGDFFRLTFIYNPNAAFGISLGQKFPYAVVSIFVIGLLFYLYYSYGRHHVWTTVSLGMILGGALGNLIDRMRMQKVVDFFDFEFFNISIPAFEWGFFQFDGYYMDRWPIFNVADIAISVGVGILFILVWFEDEPTKQGADPSEIPANTSA